MNRGNRIIKWSGLDSIAALLALRCPYDDLLLTGSRGAGKSTVAILDFLVDVGRGLGDDWRGLIVRGTYPELEELRRLIEKWTTELKIAVKYNGNQHSFKFNGGEVLKLQYMLTEGDYKAVHGHSYAWILIDELTLYDDDLVKGLLETTLRTANPRVRVRMRSTSNAFGPGRKWVYNSYLRDGHCVPQLKDNEESVKMLSMITNGKKLTPRVRIAIRMLLMENRALINANPEYVLSLLSLSRTDPIKFKAWFADDWTGADTGAFSKWWSASRQVVNSISIPDGWKLYRTLDWGSSFGVSFAIWAVSNGTPYLYRDFTGTASYIETVKFDMFRIAEWVRHRESASRPLNLSPDEVAESASWLESKLGLSSRIIPGPADGLYIHAVKKAFLDRGLTFIAADKRPGSRASGFRLIMQVLQSSFKRGAGVDANSRPGLYVCKNCREWRRTVPFLERCDGKDDITRGPNILDHTYDETRYLVSSILGGGLINGTEIIR